jgi:hypothetical protein
MSADAATATIPNTIDFFPNVIVVISMDKGLRLGRERVRRRVIRRDDTQAGSTFRAGSFGSRDGIRKRRMLSKNHAQRKPPNCFDNSAVKHRAMKPSQARHRASQMGPVVITPWS